jgi:pimeloyl-ACP methyl ester carboxylesterase
MRRAEWAYPSPPVHREVLSALPDEPTGRQPLLFVHDLAHGAWCFAEHWLDAAAVRGYPAYAVSLRGHGGSGGSRRLGRTTLRDYVHDELQTFVELHEPPVILGHSMGGLVTQQVLERYPARAGVLLAPVPVDGLLGQLLRRLPSDPVNVVGATAGRTLRLSAEDLFEGLDAATAEAYVDRLGRESSVAQWQLLVRRPLGPVRAPVLVVGTPEDRLIPVAAVEATAERFGTTPVWFPGVGHDVMLDRGQERVLDTVLDWVDEH